MKEGYRTTSESGKSMGYMCLIQEEYFLEVRVNVFFTVQMFYIYTFIVYFGQTTYAKRHRKLVYFSLYFKITSFYSRALKDLFTHYEYRYSENNNLLQRLLGLCTYKIRAFVENVDMREIISNYSRGWEAEGTLTKVMLEQSIQL